MNGELVIDEGMSIQIDYKNQVLEILKTQDNLEIVHFIGGG